MVHASNSTGQKNKPRGRPFTSKAHSTNSERLALDAKGSEISISRGLVNAANSQIPLQKNDESFAIAPLEKSKKDRDLTLIESLDFQKGENKLSIRFSKNKARMFRIQIFLNDETEIRPVTYTGSSTGYTVWNLLKGALKK